MEKKTWCKILRHNWIDHKMEGYLPVFRKCTRCERLEIDVNNDFCSKPMYKEYKLPKIGGN